MYKLAFTAVLTFSLIGSAAWPQAPPAQDKHMAGSGTQGGLAARRSRADCKLRESRD
jgi:hypothetical protein